MFSIKKKLIRLYLPSHMAIDKDLSNQLFLFGALIDDSRLFLYMLLKSSLHQK